MVSKFVYFSLGLILVILFYLVGIAIYTKVSAYPVIFFFSILLSVLGSALALGLIAILSRRRVKKKALDPSKFSFDPFSLSLMFVIYIMSINIISIFGPTFIDRSISYHVAFYAVEKGKIDVDQVREKFANAIFEKRINDAEVSGFLVKNEEGLLVPTTKAKVMYAMLMPLGELTNSLGTYNAMKEEIDE